MPTYAPTLLDEIRAGVDIVDLVGRFVNLKKTGVNWKGLCPFHGEKTPSFMVNPKKGIFHCFGCGVGGDAFGFLMRQDKLTFPEAVRALARQANVALPEERREGDSGREELLRAMDLASRFYAEALSTPAGERARKYLDGRGIDPEVARRFAMGYAPEGWDNLREFMRGEHVSEDVLLTAGLLVKRESGTGTYDRFRGRLMFAIRDLQGRVVAFGGRAFGDEQPKYLNSPETPLYTKGNLLYAADVARESIRAKSRALIVEGYVDCLMAHQYGFTETVAALGTAFTPMQLGILQRYCDEVITFFDADAAGQKAAERAEQLLEPTSGGATWAITRSGSFESPGAFRVKVALLPAGHDPDTFLRAEGAEAFAERIGAARSLLAYALDRVITDPDGAAGPRARANAFARVALLLAKVPDAQEAAALSREAARKLGIDPTQLWIEAQKLQASLRKPFASAPKSPPLRAAISTTRERDLVSFLLHAKEGREELLPLIDVADMRDERLRELLAALKARPDADAEAFMTDLADDATRSLLAALLVDDRAPEDRSALVAQFRVHLEREQRLKRQRALARVIAETQASTGSAAAVHDDQFRALHAESKVVYGIAGGVAQSLEHGPRGPQGVETNE
ncbi:MAG: DNA primase [Candidatus Rokubacteria bacterium]|nr:DNA primase [Candidatus Rokubacteria bacterium]